MQQQVSEYFLSSQSAFPMLQRVQQHDKQATLDPFLVPLLMMEVNFHTD
jgi:hypothetical protein